MVDGWLELLPPEITEIMCADDVWPVCMSIVAGGWSFRLLDDGQVNCGWTE